MRLAASAALAPMTVLAQTPASTPPVATSPLPPVVVSTAREPIPAIDVGSTVSIITGEELEQRQIRLVSDALRAVPGVAVNRSGPTGSVTQVRIRGAESNQTVVLVDGIKINDPFTSEVDFAHLLTADIDRIEILRGPQTVLYGSESIGGVISIFTKRGTRGVQSELVAEGGSFYTGTGSLALRGGTDRGNFGLSVAGITTRGTNVSRFGSETDGYQNWTLNGTGGWSFSPNASIDGALRYVNSSNEFDPQDFNFPPGPTYGLVVDGDRKSKGDQFNGRVTGRLLSFDGRWENQLSIVGTKTTNDTFADGVFSNGWEGQRTGYFYQTTLRATESAWAPALTLSAERQFQTFVAKGPLPNSPENQRQENNYTAVAGELRAKLPTATALTLSLRRDFNTLFQDATTYRVTVAQPVGESLKLRTSFGTGVANPTFFELFGFIPGSFDPNPNLKPEQSRGFDVGADIRFDGGRGQFSVTVFDTDLTDEIVTTFNPTTYRSTVTNLPGESTRRGVELELNWAITSAWSAYASYSYVNAKQPDGQLEIRRPTNLAAAALNYASPGGRWGANLGIDYNGTRQDLDFSTFATNRVSLASFTLVRLNAFYAVTRSVDLTARVENALNRDYEEVYSYRASGVGFYAGVRARF